MSVRRPAEDWNTPAEPAMTGPGPADGPADAQTTDVSTTPAPRLPTIMMASAGGTTYSLVIGSSRAGRHTDSETTSAGTEPPAEPPTAESEVRAAVEEMINTVARAGSERTLEPALDYWTSHQRQHLDAVEQQQMEAAAEAAAANQAAENFLSMDPQQLRGGQLSKCQRRGGQLSGGQLSGGQLSGGQLSGGQLSGGQLSGGQLSGGQLSGGQLSGGQPSGGQLSGGQPRPKGVAIPEGGIINWQSNLRHLHWEMCDTLPV
jgi:hypothetical protein